ncbi:hypothetical protein FQN50_004387 [Emmonsiellopsis sp. PD_5]|nr:hypothetical protein FQN50_004387 [Emmonsiellopsis sp. PD_5]
MAAIRACFQPMLDALFAPGIPFSYRWRLLTLAPLNTLAYSMKWLPWIFSRAYSVTWIPLRRNAGHPARALVFKPKAPSKSLRPLHIDIHGGGFIGGIPELDNEFCGKLVEETGAIVISLSYRLAPRHPFPAAHEDVEDAADYIVKNAERLWGANPNLLTISGFSAGGNLALGSVSQSLSDTETPVKGAVTGYPVVDLRIPPWEKPKPAAFPKNDPLAFLMPLFDAYAHSSRGHNLENPTMNPILADIRRLPSKMLFLIPGLDILVHETTTFVERLQGQATIINSQNGWEEDSVEGYKIDSILFNDQIHGWLERVYFFNALDIHRGHLSYTKAKPYHCQFCERSYGRKDLVVRHEKTLHEEQWNRTQKNTAKKKSSSSIDSMPKPSRKRRMSTLSRSDDQESTVSPLVQIQHQQWGNSNISTQLAIQTTPPISPQDSDPDCQPLFSAVSYDFSCPLTPAIHERLDYVHEASVPETNMPVVPQVSEQSYYEEQCGTQYGYPIYEISAHHYLEPQIIPIDPNLCESLRTTKKNIPLQRTASESPTCFDVLNLWPTAHASHLNGGPTPIEESSEQDTNGNIMFLQRLSQLAARTWPTLDRNNISMEHLFSNSTCSESFRKIDGFDIQLLQRCLDQFFSHFNIYTPIFHVPTFNIQTTPTPLILAMSCIGASQLSERDLCHTLLQMANECLEHDESENEDLMPATPRPIWKLQCKVLLIYAGVFLGGPNEAPAAIERVGTIHREFIQHKARLSTNLRHEAEYSWATWIDYESSKRLLCSMFITSSLLTTVYDIAPCISMSQLLELEIPVQGFLWEAPDEKTWFELMRCHDPLPESKFNDILSPLIYGQETSAIYGYATRLSNFAATVIAHAVSMHLWNIKQCTPSSLNIANEPHTKDQLQRFCYTQTDALLSRCCQFLTRRYPPIGDDYGVFDILMFLNGVAVLRSGFARAFTNIEMFDRALLLSSETLDVVSACKQYASAPCPPDQFMTDIVRKLFTGLLCPLWQLKTSENNLSVLIWNNIEHCVSIFDLLLFFTKWIHRIETEPPHHTTTPQELALMNDISEVIKDPKAPNDNATSLAARVTMVFTSLLDNHDCPGVVSRMKYVLEKLAEVYEEHSLEQTPR